jgi:DNA-binding transcriptional ArsR family regulator
MEDIFQVHAAFCRAFADPKRLRIMWALQDGERTVSELAREVGCSLPNVSQHLRMMRQQGLLTTRRDGRQIYYRIANAKFLAGCKMVREGLLEELQKRGDLSAIVPEQQSSEAEPRKAVEA